MTLLLLPLQASCCSTSGAFCPPAFLQHFTAPPPQPPPAGFLLEDTKDFNTRVFRLLAKDMGVADLAVPREDPQPEGE